MLRTTGLFRFCEYAYSDHSCTWSCVVCGLLCLSPWTQCNNVFKVYPCHSACQCFLPSYRQGMVYCAGILFASLRTSWWTFRLLILFGYGMSKNIIYASFSVHMFLVLLDIEELNYWSYDTFFFLRTCQTFLTKPHQFTLPSAMQEGCVPSTSSPLLCPPSWAWSIFLWF